MSAYQVICLGEGKVKDAEEITRHLSLFAYALMLIRHEVCFLVDTDTEFGRIANEATQIARKWCKRGQSATVCGEVCHPLGSADGKTLLDPFLAHPDEKIPEDLLDLADLIEEIRLHNRMLLRQARALIVYSDRPDGVVAYAKRYAESIPIPVYDMAVPSDPLPPDAEMPPELENPVENPSANPIYY